ncbi:MAG: serine hydrolase domain-containing protein [Bacteroidota bacterium]
MNSNSTQAGWIILGLICFIILTLVGASRVLAQTGGSREQADKQLDWLTPYLHAFHQERGFSGAVLIARHGEIVFEQMEGWQDVDKGIMNTAQTRFNLGSGNKMFTSVAIAQLAEAGKLQYDDPIINYLPNYPDQDFAKAATIKDLLRHSSGLGDYWDDEYEQHWHRLTKLQERLPFIVDDSLLFEPGSRFNYSNSGFILLGLIIENITGMSYFDYIRQQIYQKAGMNRTDSYMQNQTVDELATAYRGLGNQWYKARHGLMGTSAGGGFSNIYDILAFDLALRSNKLLGADYVRLIRSDQTPLGQSDLWQYGYGFIVDRDNERIRIGHGGRGPGVFFEYYYYPENGYTLIIFSNSESGSPQALFNKISDFITDPGQERISLPSQDTKAEDVPSFQVELVDPPDRESYIQMLESDNSSKDLHWALISHLAASINASDYDAFNRNFAKQDVVTLASNESMYNFMIKEVMPRRGKIKEFHAMGDLVEIPDSDFPIQVGTFHLEDGYPGSISISINEKGKIDHISLFVHPQICSHGPSQQCPKVAVQLKQK